MLLHRLAEIGADHLTQQVDEMGAGLVGAGLGELAGIVAAAIADDDVLAAREHVGIHQAFRRCRFEEARARRDAEAIALDLERDLGQRAHAGRRGRRASLPAAPG
jgi:hypothetical protein